MGALVPERNRSHNLSLTLAPSPNTRPTRIARKISRPRPDYPRAAAGSAPVPERTRSDDPSTTLAPNPKAATRSPTCNHHPIPRRTAQQEAGVRHLWCTRHPSDRPPISPRLTLTHAIIVNRKSKIVNPTRLPIAPNPHTRPTRIARKPTSPRRRQRNAATQSASHPRFVRPAAARLFSCW